MVSIEQLKSGVIEYIDSEILPSLPSAKRYGVMVYLTLLMDNADDAIGKLMQNPAMNAIAIVDQHSRMIDIDRLHSAAYKSMKENVQIDIPIVGRFTFSKSDIDKLYDIIGRQ